MARDVVIRGTLEASDLVAVVLVVAFLALVAKIAGNHKVTDAAPAPEHAGGATHAPHLHLGQNAVRKSARWLVLPNYAGNNG